MLDENRHLVFFSELPPNGNFAYVHGLRFSKETTICPSHIRPITRSSDMGTAVHSPRYFRAIHVFEVKVLNKLFQQKSLFKNIRDKIS